MEEAPLETETDAPAKSAGDRGMLGYLVLAAALVLAIGAGAYLFISSGGGDEPPTIRPSDAGITNPNLEAGPIDPNRPKEGEPAPDFALVDARDPSKLVKLSDFRGTPLILNWYFSDCEPCEREIPAFRKALAATGGQVTVLGVNFLENDEEALELLDKFQVTYPAVLDTSGSVAEHYRVNHFPTSFFIDKEGVLQVITTGEVDEEELVTFLGKVGVAYTP